MTTTKSYSSSRFGAFFKQALKGQLPYAIISGILSIILYLIVFFASISDNYYIVNYQDNGLTGPVAFFRHYFHAGVYAGMEQSAVVAVLLAVLALASALFGLSYMHSKKTVDLYHAMPITRPHLLLANLLASFTAIVVPWLGVYASTMLVQLIGFGRYGWVSPAYFGFILFDIASICVYIAVVLAFVAFITVNVGTVFDAFAVSMAIGFSPPTVYLISGTVWSRELYGAIFDPGGGILCLSPFLYHFYHFVLLDSSGKYATFNYAASAGIVLGGLVAAAVFCAAALVCYNRRHSEIAEQTQSSGVFQMIVKCVAAFLGSAALYGVFNDSPLPAKLLGMLFGAVLIGTIAELILSRGVKNLKRSFKWLAVAGACYCAVLLIVHLDWFGYVRRVPDPVSVASVTINYDGRFTGARSTFYPGDGEKATLTSPESIAIVTTAHRLATQNQPPRGNRGYYDYSSGSSYSYEYLTLEYTLKNGSRLRRTYGDIYRPAYAELASLEDKDDFVMSRCPLFLPEQSLPLPMRELVVDVYAHGPLSEDYLKDGVKLELDSAGRQRLLDALRADLLAETLGEITNPSEPALGFLQLEIVPVDRFRMDSDLPAAARAEDYSTKYGFRTMTLVITREFRNTLALLPPDAFVREVPGISMAAVEPFGGYASNARVQVFGTGGSGHYSREYENDESWYAITDDPGDIEKLRAAALIRLLPGEDCENEYVMIRFFLRNDWTIVLPVRRAELPAGLRAEFENKQRALDEAASDTEVTVPIAVV